jgi:hypothetical protein
MLDSRWKDAIWARAQEKRWAPYLRYFYGCLLLYADDISLISSLLGLQSTLHVRYALLFIFNFNCSKCDCLCIDASSISFVLGLYSSDRTEFIGVRNSLISEWSLMSETLCRLILVRLYTPVAALFRVRQKPMNYIILIYKKHIVYHYYYTPHLQ